MVAIPVDEERTKLRFSLLVGYLLADCPSDALLIGNLLELTPFHVLSDMELGLLGRLSVGCDLIVRADDEPLVRRRFGELLELGKRRTKRKFGQELFLMGIGLIDSLHCGGCIGGPGRWAEDLQRVTAVLSG